MSKKKFNPDNLKEVWPKFKDGKRRAVLRKDLKKYRSQLAPGEYAKYK